MRLSVVIATIILTMTSADAQVVALTPTQAEDLIAGSKSHEWVLGSVVSLMGATKSCSGGEVDRFFRDHMMQREECLVGHPVDSTHTWRAGQGVSDLCLFIDDQEYELRVRQGGGHTFMRLRARSESKILPTFDREYRLSDE